MPLFLLIPSQFLWPILIFKKEFVQLVFNMEQGLPLLPDWLVFTRVNVRGRQGIRIGPARCVAR